MCASSRPETHDLDRCPREPLAAELPQGAAPARRGLARARLGARAAASLTPDGERAALLVLRRHRILETFLVQVLALDWSEVHDDAEELEHHVSDRVLDALDRYMRHPTEDPHGNPIPDSRGRVERRALAPLSALPAGARARVREVRAGDDPASMRRWKRTG